MQTHSKEELQEFAADFAGTLAPRSDRATIVALSGELGAGKTTFTQGVAATLGVRETVASPTFILEKIYALPMTDLRSPSFERLIHIDAYRLTGEHELKALLWDDVVANPHNLILLEWPERIPGAIPEDAIRIRFDIDGDGRIITIDDIEIGKESESEKNS